MININDKHSNPRVVQDIQLTEEGILTLDRDWYREGALFKFQIEDITYKIEVLSEPETIDANKHKYKYRLVFPVKLDKTPVYLRGGDEITDEYNWKLT